MTKEPGQPPKAVNIIRPNTNYGILHNTTSTSSSGSSNSGSIIQQQKRNASHSANSSVLSSNRKPRVNNQQKMIEKPILNLYHPPTRKPSYDRNINSTSNNTTTTTLRPNIEIYKPQQHQPQRMTKSLTAPSLSSSSGEHSINNNRPISPFHIRPSHRSVLGPIVTPAATTTTQSPTTTDNNLEQSLLEGIMNNQDLINNVQDDISEEDDDSEDEEDVTKEEEEEEDLVINEARVNRKIADLELSINSLLTVNAMLEATVRKQASQLNQMKQKMLAGESVDTILNDQVTTIVDIVEEDEEEEDWDKDVLFQRLRKITEYMIEQGQKSVNYEYKILGRVLSNYEQDDEEDETEEDDTTQNDDTTTDTTIETTTTTTTTTTLPPPLPSKSNSDTTLSSRSIPVPSSIPLPTTHINNRIPKAKRRSK